MSWVRRIEAKKSKLFEEKLKVFESISRADCDGANAKVFQPGEHFFESLYMGNLNRSDVESLFKEFYTSVQTQGDGRPASPSDDGKVKVAEDVILSSDILYFDKKVHIALQVPGTNPDESNGSTVYTLQVPESSSDSLEGWINLSLYNQIVSQKCFDTLRTKEQLGYIVAAQPTRNASQKHAYSYVVQSEQPPWKVKTRIESFARTIDKFFANGMVAEAEAEKEKAAAGEAADGEKVGAEAAEGEKAAPPTEEDQRKEAVALFDQYRTSLLSQFEERPKKLAEEFSGNWARIGDRTFQFHRREEAVQIIKDLTMEKFLEFANNMTLDKCSSICVEVYPPSMEGDRPTDYKDNEAEGYLALTGVEGIIERVHGSERMTSEFGRWIPSSTKIDM